MSSPKELKEDLEAVSSIRLITSIYQEIASFRMNQLRDRAEKTREFLDGVSAVYNHAKTAYIASVINQPFQTGRKKAPDLRLIRRNSKKINVFLSANEHLYGTLILDIWGHYVNDLKQEGSEAAVIGSFGKYLINNERLDTKITYFDLDDDKPEGTEIKKIIDFLSQYEQVAIYHGQMISVLNQIPAKTDITGGIKLGQSMQKSVKRYLFEPSPEKVLEFFEAEIIGALFNQSILEHQLARFAARMVAMDQATENANEELKKIANSLRSLRRRILNRKQLEIFAGYSLWGQPEVSKQESVFKIGKEAS